MDSPVSPRAATPRPTIKDIASAAGVSNVTVSRVLNTPELVREETRGRVEAAMRRLGYTPNLAARAMRTRFTRTIGFLVPDILSYPNAAVAQAAEQALAAAGYGMMLVSSGDRHEDELRALEMLRTHRMDGMIVYVGDESDADMIGTLSELGGPCVVLDRTLPIEADVVLSDHAPALEEAIRYLVSLGHRSLAMVLSDRRVRPVFERRRAFQAAITAAGLDPDRQTIVAVRPEEKARFRAADLFARAAPPTAVLVDGSRFLRAVMDGLRRHRLRIPDDVSVVGIDVEDVAPAMTPELTRISRDYGEIGRTAAGFLLNRIRSGPGPRQTALLESHVLLKSSCAPVTQAEGVS